jgi:hypothetical protein
VAAAALVLAVATTSSAQPLRLAAEPGVLLEGGGALVPFRLADSSGTGFPVRAGEVTVESDGGSVLAAELVGFAGPGAEPSAIHVLVDPASLEGADAAAWAGEMATFLRPDGSGEARAVRIAGPEREELAAAAPVEEIRERLAAGGDGALWDRALQALDRLSRPGLPARRVLLLVANGEEARESRHPAATCADAADTARVCVWVLVPGDAPPAGRARLAALAARTGGAIVDAGSRGAGALPATLGRIRAVQALRLRALPSAPPLAVSLRAASAPGPPARAWVRARRPLGLGGRPFPWLPLLVSLGVGVVAGGFVLMRALPVGHVRGVAGLEAVARVTRAGLTIGGAVGNGLVVPDPRVSRSHAVIRMEKGRAVLVDLRSANGTKVNGRRISSAPLEDGDRILLAEAVELIWEGGFRFGKGR